MAMLCPNKHKRHQVLAIHAQADTQEQLLSEYLRHVFDLHASHSELAPRHWRLCVAGAGQRKWFNRSLTFGRWRLCVDGLRARVWRGGLPAHRAWMHHTLVHGYVPVIVKQRADRRTRLLCGRSIFKRLRFGWSCENRRRRRRKRRRSRRRLDRLRPRRLDQSSLQLSEKRFEHRAVRLELNYTWG
jgi:hypothetical protein